MFCSKCGTENIDSARFCQKCGAQLSSVLPPPPSAATPPAADPRVRGGQQPPAVPGEKQYATGKNPVVALILSALIVGVGQFYNGDTKKGIVMLLGAIILGALTFGLGWLGILIWSAVDAYQVASGTTPLWS